MKNINILLYIASPIKSIEMTRMYCKKKKKLSIDHFRTFKIMYTVISKTVKLLCLRLCQITNNIQLTEKNVMMIGQLFDIFTQ